MDSDYKSSNNYSTVHEPETNNKAEESDYQEAISQREPEYESETVYEVAGTGNQYQAGLTSLALMGNISGSALGNGIS